MAKTQNIPPTPPFADIRAETIENLDAVKEQLEEAEKDIEVLTKLGMDVSRLKERVEWGKKARDLMLKRYGKTE